MSRDKVSLNGKFVPFEEAGFAPEYLLGVNFVYQKLHALSYETLQANAHVEIAEVSYNALYGQPAGISRTDLESDVRSLLLANRYPAASNQLILYLVPPEKGAGVPSRLLVCEKQLLYKGYTIWHSGLKALTVPYDYPFPEHKTAASLAAHNCALEYALRKGSQAAICENRDGIAVGVGENPLFALTGEKVFTTPIECGAAESVERRMGIAACQRAGLAVFDEPVECGSLASFDELFTVTPQGVISIAECGGKLFPHSMAKKIADHMTAIKL